VRVYGTERQDLAYALRDKRLLGLTPSVAVMRPKLSTVEEEMAVTLEDFLNRRTDLMLFDPRQEGSGCGRAGRP
jgi:glycerol-3-phosphate dehydrogenase